MMALCSIFYKIGQEMTLYKGQIAMENDGFPQGAPACVVGGGTSSEKTNLSTENYECDL